MGAVSSGFFSGTHQRIPALSKIRFYQNLQSLTATPDADFATLCLSILLLQQFPTGPASSVQSPLYTTVKGLTTILEASSDVSIDLVHCRVLVAFYEMGHGLHTAAYVSVAAAARLARVLGLHRKSWRHCLAVTDNIMLEEKKRVWWAITNMDRFVNLCSGDAFFVTNESERSDPLPIEDLLWSETLDAVALEDMITRPPTLDTPFDTRVGQMARECQIFHLVGRVVRHVFDPLPDQDFNAEEAVLLERTLKAYLPLLANEELEIGKYCGAFGACNRSVTRPHSVDMRRVTNFRRHSAIFILYEFMLSRCDDSSVERARLVHAIQETSISAITFAEATHRDRSENYPIETQSPYLIYSLYQAAVVQHRLWKQHRDPQWRCNIESLREIIYAFTGKWMIACMASHNDSFILLICQRAIS